MILRGFCIHFAFFIATFLAVNVRADIVDFVMDSSQSYVDLTIVGADAPSTQRSQTTGFGKIDLSPTTEPFGQAQITELNQTLVDGLGYSVGGGLATLSTTGGNVMTNLVTPGAAGTVSAGQFDQLANMMELLGNVDVTDPSNIIGGTQTLDLSTIVLDPIDFTDVTISRTGNTLTISGDYLINATIDTGTMGVPIVLAGSFLATGAIAIPEPGGLVFLMVAFNTVLLKRKRDNALPA